MQYQYIPTTCINLFPLLIKAMPLLHWNIPCYHHTNILSRIDNFQIQWETIFILTIYMQCVGIEATYLCILYFLSIFIRVIYLYTYDLPSYHITFYILFLTTSTTGKALLDTNHHYFLSYFNISIHDIHSNFMIISIQVTTTTSMKNQEIELSYHNWLLSHRPQTRHSYELYLNSSRTSQQTHTSEQLYPIIIH